MQLEIISNSSRSTAELGKKFSKVLSRGDVVVLSGELGGGKTTFITGIACGLGLKANISSPSFTIVNEYPGKKFNFVHADLYRLDNAADLETVGLGDYVYNDYNIICIEWGNRAGDFLTRDHIAIEFCYQNENDNGMDKRIIIFRVESVAWERKLSIFKKLAGIQSRRS